MKQLCFLLCIALLLLLSGCKDESNYRNAIPQPVLRTTDGFLDNLIQGNAEPATKVLIPELRNKEGEKLVSDGIAAFKTSPILSSSPYEIVLYGINGEIFGSHYEITYQMERKNGWLLVHVGLDDVKGQFLGITSLDFRYIPISLQELHAFTFVNKPWKHYAVLAVCGGIIALVAVSFVLLLRTKTEKPWIRWAWGFLILIGMVRVTFNWTSGEFALYPTGGVGDQVLYHMGFVVNIIHYSPYEPWYIQFLLPVGAIVFLWRRKALIAMAERQKV